MIFEANLGIIRQRLVSRGPACRQAGVAMYFVYVIKIFKTGQLYKGLTSNLNRRLHDHKKTKGYFDLVFVELCDSRQEARKLEIYFKSGFGREILKELGF